MNVIWRYPVHHRVNRIAFSQERAYLPASHSRIVCLDLPTGEELWRTEVRNVWGWLALSDDAVVYLSQHDELVAMGQDTGEVWWKRKLGGIFGWLHAFAGSIVVGGWRGYTDIHCLDTATGERRWSYPAQKKSLHRTMSHAGLDQLVVCEPDTQSVVLLDIDSGAVTARIRVPGVWTDIQVDSIPVAAEGSMGGLSQATLLKRSSDSLYRISGGSPRLETLEVGHPIFSRQLEERDGVVGFLDERHRFCTYEIGEGRLTVYDKLHEAHPYAGFWCKGNQGYFAATGQGLIYRFAPGGTERLKVGKRIRAPLAYTDGMLCTGTYSGEVVGIDVGCHQEPGTDE